VAADLQYPETRDQQAHRWCDEAISDPGTKISVMEVGAWKFLSSRSGATATTAGRWGEATVGGREARRDGG
jgi:hypothetical protein